MTYKENGIEYKKKHDDDIRRNHLHRIVIYIKSVGAAMDELRTHDSVSANYRNRKKIDFKRVEN